MPSFQLPHFNDIAVLRSIEPNRFRTFLVRFEKYLSSQEFKIPEDATFTDAHLQQLIGIFNANDSSTPADMIEALFHVSEVANDQGMEALLVVASKTGIELPEGDLTPADLALLIWLYDPDLLRRANCERIVRRFQSFYYRIATKVTGYVPRAIVNQLIQRSQLESLTMGGVHRDVSVMFADIRGFTVFSQDMAPQNVVLQLNSLLEIMVNCTFESEGTLDKFIGDAILVLFNVPLDQPDHVERAVRTC